MTSKKDFSSISNPAERFLSTPESEEERSSSTTAPEAIFPTGALGKPPKGYKLNPLYVEVKSRRVQLLLRPSLYNALLKQAKAQGVSFNDMANTILQAYIDKE